MIYDMQFYAFMKSNLPAKRCVVDLQRASRIFARAVIKDYGVFAEQAVVCKNYFTQCYFLINICDLQRDDQYFIEIGV